MKRDGWPLVTVFTLVYNTGKYVVEAIESVQANHYPNIEHIVIDDCSKDDSIQIVQKWLNENHYPCTFIKHTENKGVCKSLNEVLKLATGKYVFGISDDLINPDYIMTSVDILEHAGDDFCLTFCNSTIVNENGIDLNLSFYGAHDPDPWLTSSGYAFEAIIRSNFINGIGALYRKKYLDEVGGYDESLYFEDWDIHIRLLKKYKIKKINQRLTRYRRRSNSISESKDYRYYESLLLICFKILEMKEADKRVIRKSIVDYIEYYFKGGGPSNVVYKDAFMKTMNIKTIIFMLFKWVGLNYKAYGRLKNAIA